MKAKLFFFGMLCFNLSFGQNQSITTVAPAISAVTPVTFPPSNTAPNEIFRFAPGNVTQLDNAPLGSATNFNFSNSRWFSLGAVETNQSGTRRAYGLRFQAGPKAVTFGYQNVLDPLDINPRIQWIGSDAALGNLEFRVANSFNSTNSKLVASMLPNGSTFFGTTTDNPNTVGLSSGVLNVRNSEFVVDSS